MTRVRSFHSFPVVLWVAFVLLASAGEPVVAAEPTGELAGIVVDLDGRPVPDATIRLESRPASTIASVKTFADGRFRMGPIAPICRQSLLVDAPGFAREHRENVSIFPNAVNEIRIVLAPGRTVQGRILRLDGQPAAHVGVTYHVFRIQTGRYLIDEMGPEGRVTTDSNGGFRAENVPPCRFIVDVRLPETASGWVREDIQPGLGLHRLRTLRLAPDLPIAGIVHDSQGKPLAKIPVETNWANSPTAITDAAGRFTLRGFPADQIPRVAVVISTPEFAYKRVSVGNHPSAVDIALTPQRWISGRVEDANSGAPVAIKTLILCWFTRGANGQIDRGNCRPVPFEQSKSGQFRVAYRAPDDIHITVRSSGYDDAEANLDIRPKYEDINGIVIKARRNGSTVPADVIPVARITGRITRDGKPIASAWVIAIKERTERKLPYVDIQRGRTVHTQSVPMPSVMPTLAGVYSLELRNADRWFVVVEEPNHAPTIRGPFAMKLNQTRALDIALDADGAISGRVRRIARDSAGQWWVVAFDRGVRRAETRVAKDGTFELARLPAGEFTLKVGHDAYHEAGNPDHPTDEEMQKVADPWHGTSGVLVRPGQIVRDVLLDTPPVTPAPQAPRSIGAPVQR
jgi:Carboxypeptidase regulatory-like domain